MTQFIFTIVEQMRFLYHAWAIFGISTWTLWTSIICTCRVIIKCEISRRRYILFKFVTTMKHIEFFKFMARGDLEQVIILDFFLNYLQFRLGLKRLLEKLYIGLTLSVSSVMLTYYQCTTNVLLYLFNYHLVESFRRF